MENNGIKTDVYYKLMSTGDVQLGYISFSPYDSKNGREYSVKCKVACRCDRIVLCKESFSQDINEECIIIRRINPNESGVFTYFNINRENIDNFISKAMNSNVSIRIDLRYKEQTMCGCLITERKKEKTAFPEIETSFDPFDTTNTAYSWDVITDIKQLLEKNLIHGQMFIKLAMRALAEYEHLLVGKYTAPEGEFCIIGIPADKEYGHNEFGRWVSAHRRYKDKKYNGYRLFYFNEANKRMVRPILVRG